MNEPMFDLDRGARRFAQPDRHPAPPGAQPAAEPPIGRRLATRTAPA